MNMKYEYYIGNTFADTMYYYRYTKIIYITKIESLIL